MNWPKSLNRRRSRSAIGWRRRERDAGRRNDGLSSEERDELSRLRRENRQLRQERDILAKAAAWFAQRRHDAIEDSGS